MRLTPEILDAALPDASGAAVRLYAGPLADACEEFGIITAARLAGFLAQIGHESGSLHYVHELASGDAYEGRADLGNTEPGDGRRYKGRGLIQITGRSNYAACGAALGLDLVAYPELLEEPVAAARSAAWFWSKHGLNQLADQGDFLRITKRINGGTNGWADRCRLYALAGKALGIPVETAEV